MVGEMRGGGEIKWDIVYSTIIRFMIGGKGGEFFLSLLPHILKNISIQRCFHSFYEICTYSIFL